MAEYTRNEIEMQVKISRTIAALASAMQYHPRTGDSVNTILLEEIKRLSETPIVVVDCGVSLCPHYIAGDCQ